MMKQLDTIRVWKISMMELKTLSQFFLSTLFLLLINIHYIHVQHSAHNKHFFYETLN